MSAAAPQLYSLPSPDRWLTTEQTLAATGWSAFWLREKAKAGDVTFRESQKVAANGRRLREYLAASLPPEARARLAGTVATVPEERRALLAAPLFSSQPPAMQPARVALPDPSAQQQAEERLAILSPLLDFAADPARYVSLQLTDGRPVTSLTRFVAYQAAAHNVSERTVKLWLQRWREGGLAALADKQRSDKGRSRWFEDHRRAACLAAFLYLDCRQSFRMVYEAILQDETLEIAEDELPSYETVRAFLSNIPPYLKTFAREGRQAYQGRMSPYVRRGYADIAANQVWVSDHMIHDVEVLNDVFPEAPWGSPVRMRFTCLLDFRARYVVGTSWCWEGSSRSIATAMRRAVMQHGPCEHFYCDNGKDYRKVAKGATPAYLSDSDDIRGWHETELARIHETGILGRLGIKVTHCIVRHPQSKHVERFFRTLHEQFDKRWRTYTGGASHLRPDGTTAAMELHRKLLKHGRVQESLHPPASYFIALCMAWIDEYHHRPHSGEGMEERTPAQVFAEDRSESQRSAPEPHELAVLLADHTRRKVRECSIELNKHRYTYADAVSRDVLHEMNEREVTVAFDPLDPEAVAILDEGGHFLCWAKSETFLKFNPADKDTQRQIGDSMADRRHLEKQTRNLLDGITRTARTNGARNPVEMLAERAQLPSLVEQTLTHRAPKLKPDPEAAAPPSAADIAANFMEALK